MTRRMLLVGVALLVWALSAQGQDVGPYPDYTFTARDELLAAQACVHEVSWAGGTATSDCGMIIQVAMSRRHEGESFATALATRTMPRFYRRETDRAWARGLPEGPITRNPEGWPYDYPARVHSDHWRSVVFRVHGYMRGTEELPCTPAPVRWFGRTTDGEQLAIALADGWCEPRCVGDLRNAPLVRCADMPAESSGDSSAGVSGPELER